MATAAGRRQRICSRFKGFFLQLDYGLSGASLMGRPASFSLLTHVSEREAAAAERAPEGSQIADRQTCRPGGRVVVAVDAAMVRASARGGKRPSRHGLSGTVADAPCAIAAKAPNRPPARHRGRPAR